MKDQALHNDSETGLFKVAIKGERLLDAPLTHDNE
jgi:hypothetical protein